MALVGKGVRGGSIRAAVHALDVNGSAVVVRRQRIVVDGGDGRGQHPEGEDGQGSQHVGALCRDCGSSGSNNFSERDIFQSNPVQSCSHGAATLVISVCFVSVVPAGC